MVDEVTPAGMPGLGLIEAKTSNYGGHPPEFWAERLTEKILSRTDFIVIEMPLFGQYNEGVPNFLEHIKFMDSIGFITFDIVDKHYINGFNMQIDMLFISKNHKMNETVQTKLY